MSNYNQLILTYENGLQDVIELNDVIIPYGEYQFRQIAAVEVPEIVEQIGDYVFADNNNLSAITLSEGLIGIGGQAFQHGVYSSVTIPSTVQVIGMNAFNISEEQELGEAGDLYITCLATTPTWMDDFLEHKTFGDPEYLQAIYVPAESVEDYKAASDWEYYADKIQAIPTPTTGFSTLDIVSAYVGTEIVERLYMGDELVWGNEPVPPTPDPGMLRMDITGDGYINWYSNDTAGTILCPIEYSFDSGNTWTTIMPGTGTDGNHIDVYSGDSVWFKGYNPAYAVSGSSTIVGSKASTFSGSTAQFTLHGSIMSLCYGENYLGQTACTNPFQFANLFRYCTGLTYADIELPYINSAATSCYLNLFINCTSLTGISGNIYGDVLPEGSLAATFRNCTVLTRAPQIYVDDMSGPSAVTPSYVIFDMFMDCPSLNFIVCNALVPNTASNSWVSRVSSTGTFVKNPNATGWTTGANGIPSGWTVEDMGFYTSAATIQSGASTDSIKWNGFDGNIPASFSSSSEYITGISYSNGYIYIDSTENSGETDETSIIYAICPENTYQITITKKGHPLWIDIKNWIPSHNTATTTVGSVIAVRQGVQPWTGIQFGGQSAGTLSDAANQTATAAITAETRTTFMFARSTPYCRYKPTGTTTLSTAVPTSTTVIDGYTCDVYDLGMNMYLGYNATRFNQYASGIYIRTND